MKKIRMSCDRNPDADFMVVDMDAEDVEFECFAEEFWNDLEDTVLCQSAVTITRSKAITLAKSILDYYGELDGDTKETS
jgi:hypothetical protein